MNNYKILIGGYDFEQKIHRGTTFYAKALVRALKENNLTLLTSAKKSKIEKIKLLHILRQLDNPLDVGGKRKLIFYVKYYIKEFINLKSFDIIKNNSDLEFEKKLLYLRNIDYFYNIPYIYSFLGIHNRFFLQKPFNLTIKGNFDVAVFTSPTNIKLNIPLVQTLHDVLPLSCIVHPPSDNAEIFYYRVKNMLKYSDKIISVSNFSKEECLKLFPGYEDKIEVTYQPIPIYEEEEKIANEEFVQDAILKKYNLKKDNYLFYVGMLEKRKNIKSMLEAYLAVKDKINIPFVVAGALGYGKEEFKGYLNKDGVRYLQYINNIEKLVLMKNARAFIFLSLNEGFGLPPLEAMRMGIVSLISNISALPEVCGDAAFYVNPYSLSEIKDGLIEISLNESLREKLKSNFDKQLKRFSFESFRKKINKLIDSI